MNKTQNCVCDKLKCQYIENDELYLDKFLYSVRVNNKETNKTLGIEGRELLDFTGLFCKIREEYNCFFKKTS